MFDKATDKAADYVRRVERAGVENPRLIRRFVIVGAVWWGVAFACLFLVQLDHAPLVLSAVTGPLLGCYIGLSALKRTTRALAYRSGWLDGRTAMVSALSEAMRREWPIEDWLRGELERDMAVIAGRVGHEEEDEA
jgi:hypothetical protein